MYNAFSDGVFKMYNAFSDGVFKIYNAFSERVFKTNNALSDAGYNIDCGGLGGGECDKATMISTP